MYVIKRDGTRVLFNPNKIVNAINKAMISVDGSLYETETAEEIANIIGRHAEDMTVEYIQDCVEKELMKSERPDVAKAYILYRDERSQVRDRKSKLIHTVMKRTNAMAIENANANVDEYSFSGREKEASADIQKIIALDYTLSPEVSRAHREMLLYQHDMEKTNIGQHNCFGRETKFITIDGVKSFYDFEHGDEVIILNAKGEWEKAIVHNHGAQDLNRITFKNGAWNTKVVRATKNHTWLLKDYGQPKQKEIPGMLTLSSSGKTNALKVGDKILKAPTIFKEFNYEDYSIEELMFWCRGFAFGDGTVEYDTSKVNGHTYKSNRTRIRLCGQKDSAFLPIFERAKCQIRSQVADNGDRFVSILNYHKEVPEFSNINEMYLFFNGLYSADGTITNKTSSGKRIYSIQSSKLEVIGFIKQYAEALGMYITGERDLTGQKTNYGIRPYTINFSFNPDFAFSYKVLSIEPDAFEEVWCLETETTNTFVLSGGIPTGNCLFVDFKKLFTDGFVTRNGDIRPPSTFSTACQQIAVIFQCQSQVQFGGVGSSHLDYDLAPFVVMSFRKHIKNYLTDVEDYTEEKAKEIMLAFEQANGTIRIDNKEMQGQHGMQDAYNYAMKQLEREGRQSAEALYHNLNTLESRAGSQVPFTSINFGRDETAEGRLVSKWMLDASLAGVGKHHLTPIFPISIFQYKAGCNANPEDENYDLKQHALESLSKRIYPNFVNCDWSQANENLADPDTFFSTMGKCKLQPM
ncbi:MAG: anaerobic ribonucleoside-triphosphate reductase [Candidatus Pacebacteria bacterium]|nr:anaerobic ribonucleoside-triphosphate reductase [Candidatus Paceibacterota bacterium]